MSNIALLAAWLKTLPRAAGVYMIECLVTGDRYVGSACKQFVASRLAQELSDLKAGHHHSSLLQTDWDRYGSEAFAWLAQATESGRQALLVEHWLTRVAKAFADFGGYVLRADINSVTASIFETERKLAASRGGRKFEYLRWVNPQDRIHPTMIRTFCQDERPLIESKNLSLDVDEYERLRLLHDWVSGAIRFNPTAAPSV